MKRATWILVFGLGAMPATGQALVDAELQFESVVTGLTAPTAMAFLGDGDFLVAQKNDGRVVRIVGGVLQMGEVLDLHVNIASERGLLGLAADPDVAHNGHVYVYYTESSTGADTSVREDSSGNRVYRYTWNGTALVDPRLLLDLPDDTEFPGIVPGNHNGGVLAFGPDDQLYAIIGDQSRGQDEFWASQLQNDVNGAPPNDTGVIFRVNTGGHGLPDNPLVNRLDAGDPRNRYYGYGLRNSFGLAFDPVSGSLWDSENGPADNDELNRVFPGYNGGWFRIKGPVSRDAEGQVDLWVAPGSTYGDPQFTWIGRVAPTALQFVHSRKLGCDLENDLIVGDVNCGQLYRFELDGARQSFVFASPDLQDRVADGNTNACSDEVGELIFGTGFSVVTDLENGPDGRLYVVEFSAGAVGRIAPTPGAVTDVDGDEVEDNCDCDPADVGSFAAPREVPRLRLFGSTPTTVGWDSQQATAGAGTGYTVITGEVANLRSDSGFVAACTFVTNLNVPATSDARTPLSGGAFYYLVRAANGCASATFGDGSVTPDPRDDVDALLPPACVP